MFAHHKFNEHAAVESVAARIESGETIALVSDAGTPGISDPGFLLVRTCIAHGVEVETLPGATAFVPALIQSGFPADRFCFEGFLPQKKGRNKRLEQLKEETRTIIFYESPYRVVKTLEQLAVLFGPERPVSVSRELTKKSRKRSGEGWTKWLPISGSTNRKGNSSSFLPAGRPHGPRKMKVSTTNDWKP